MKELLVAMIVVLPVSSFAQDKSLDYEPYWQSRSWTRGELVLAGSYILASSLDAIQTSKFSEIDGASEGNPLLRNDDVRQI